MYKDKIHNYQGDVTCMFGKYENFSEYIAQFAKKQNGHGVDMGAGPGGCNRKFFTQCSSVDGCDAQIDVVNSLPQSYSKKFQYFLGSEEKLPYKDGEKDFAICSCVIQHLKNKEELEMGMEEISRILKSGGKFYLMFKAGTNDTNLTHFNNYYSQQRTFRVFHPDYVRQLLKTKGFEVMKEEKFLDESHWIPYCNMICQKN